MSSGVQQRLQQLPGGLSASGTLPAAGVHASQRPGVCHRMGETRLKCFFYSQTKTNAIFLVKSILEAQLNDAGNHVTQSLTVPELFSVETTFSEVL